MKKRLLSHAVVLMMAAACFHAQAGTCKLVALVPQGDMLPVEGVGRVSLGEADNKAHPTAWQGPVTMGACSLDLGIVEAPLIGAGAGSFYLTTYSGAVRKVALIDSAACKVVWKSAPFVGQVKVVWRGLKLGGTTIVVDEHCMPRRRR